MQEKGEHDLVKQLDLERRCSKVVNFLTSYGGGAQGLMSVLAAQGVYKTLEECRDIIDSFFNAYPALKDLIAVYKKFIYDNGCAVSILGRVRWFDDVYSEDSQLSSKALRAGVNHLIQSTASDMMLMTLCYIEECMRAENLESVLVLTVHDSLLIDAKRNELDRVHAIVTEAMNNIPMVLKYWFGEDYNTSWMTVPFEGDSEIGVNYSDMLKISSKSQDWKSLLEQAAG